MSWNPDPVRSGQGPVFMAACTCGIGAYATDRQELERKMTAHLKGDFQPAERAPAHHAAWIGKATSKLGIDVKTEELPQ